MLHRLVFMCTSCSSEETQHFMCTKSIPVSYKSLSRWLGCKSRFLQQLLNGHGPTEGTQHFSCQHCTLKCFLAYVKDQMVYACCCCVPLPFGSLQFSPPFSSETSPYSLSLPFISFWQSPQLNPLSAKAPMQACFSFVSSLYPACSDNSVNVFTQVGWMWHGLEP